MTTKQTIELDILWDTAGANLRQRMSEHPSFTQAEVTKVANFSTRLFARACHLEEDTADRLRALCRFSQCALKPNPEITSHRPLIGPVIVFFKRLTWPLIKVHLEPTFQAQEEFFGLLVEEICAARSAQAK